MSVAIAMALLPVGWFISEKQKIELLCEKQILQAQENLVTGENQLITLNSPAQTLVLEKKSLEAAIAATPAPPVQAALAARLAIVIAQIRALRFRQQWILKMFEARAQGSLMVLQNSVRTEVAIIQKKLQSSRLLVFLKMPTPRVKLLPVYIDPLIPIYETPPAFSFLQTLTVEIEIQGRRFFPDWMKLISTQRNFRWREFCFSHPKQGGFRWESYLGVGKSF